ncbi:MAG: hypothetical protein Q8K75_10570 [Chlamydiales bacterium]|nr:hypothetical protein [Chlamydiales bacterium]
MDAVKRDIGIILNDIEELDEAVRRNQYDSLSKDHSPEVLMMKLDQAVKAVRSQADWWGEVTYPKMLCTDGQNRLKDIVLRTQIGRRLVSIEKRLQNCEEAVNGNRLEELCKNHSTKTLRVRLDRCIKDIKVAWNEWTWQYKSFNAVCIRHKQRLQDLSDKLCVMQERAPALEDSSLPDFNDLIDQIYHQFQVFAGYGASLNEGDIKKIGRTLWQNRILFSYQIVKNMTIGEKDKLRKLQGLCCSVLRKKVASARSHKRDFVSQLMDRLMTPSFPMHLIDVLAKNYLSSKNAKNICLALAPIEPEFAGALAATLINMDKLSFSVLFKNPEYQTQILPRIKCINFSNVTILSFDQYKYSIQAFADLCPNLERVRLIPIRQQPSIPDYIKLLVVPDLEDEKVCVN